MIITKISPAAKTPGRYNIFVDGKYSFSLDELQLIQTGIKKDQEIDPDQLAELQGESDFGKNYIRALDLISRRPRSIKEIRDYGFRKRWLPENTDRVVTRLLERGYLNDQLFAQMYARSRMNQNRYSLKRIRLDLRHKGISSDIIDQVLADTDNDTTTLDRLVAKKYHRYDEAKLKSYLARNGFRYDDINAAIDRYRQQHPLTPAADDETDCQFQG